MNQKLEDLLQLALQTPEDVRERTDELNIGFNGNTRTWELIVKYHGSLDQLKALGIKVEYLIAGYAILTVPEMLVELMVELEEIEYVEKPKRYFYGDEMPANNSCVLRVTLRDPFLTGRGVLIAILDSGIDYRLPEFRNPDGSTRIRYLWDQSIRPEEEGTDNVDSGAGMEVGAGAGSGNSGSMNEGGIAGDENDIRASLDRENNSMENGQRQDGERFRRRPPAGFQQGVEFDAEQINRALSASNQQEQFELLPSVDGSGHGTAVAGIAAGNSKAYQGVAPEADLLIVKLGLPDAFSFPRTTEIMRAITYVVKKAIEMEMPVAINLSFGNTYGAHDGTSLLERFLDNASEIGRTVICVGAGNEGNNGGHLSGSLLREDGSAGRLDIGTGGRNELGTFLGQDMRTVPSRTVNAIARSASVELAVAEYERSLNVQLWKNYCDKYRIYLRSPGGQEAQLPEMINGGKYTLRLEQTEIFVYFGQPAPYAVPEEIYFEFLPLERNYINSGVWTIRLEPERVVTGRYYFYLPSAVVRSKGTGFYRSTPEVTLTIPSTAGKVISVGAYDSTYEAYADFSGRGYADANRTIGIVAAGLAKPDLAAPGVGILAPDIYGAYSPFTGTSFATPIVTGSAALLMEWGIVRGNDPFLYDAVIIGLSKKILKNRGFCLVQFQCLQKNLIS